MSRIFYSTLLNAFVLTTRMVIWLGGLYWLHLVAHSTCYHIQQTDKQE